MCGASDAIVRTWLWLQVRWEPWQEQAWTDVLTVENRRAVRVGEGGDSGDCPVLQPELLVPGDGGGGVGEERISF